MLQFLHIFAETDFINLVLFSNTIMIMRKPFLFLFSFFLFFPSVLIASSFQPDSLVIAEPVLQHRFCDLEVDRVPEGILYDYGVTPVDYRDYNGLPQNENCYEKVFIRITSAARFLFL